jgi:hypothetical protein
MRIISKTSVKEITMKRIILLTLGSMALVAAAGSASAQEVVGTTRIGLTVEESKEIAVGWSAKKQVLGEPVYNEDNEKVGTIGDLIITPDKAISYAIIGAGGFIGVGKHNVTIPITQLQYRNGKSILPGATKDAIKTLPEFEYAKSG